MILNRTGAPSTKKAKPTRCRLGIIGAGIFASEGYASALLQERQQRVFDIKAVYSRSQAKAENLAAKLSNSSSASPGPAGPAIRAYYGNESSCKVISVAMKAENVCTIQMSRPSLCCVLPSILCSLVFLFYSTASFLRLFSGAAQQPRHRRRVHCIAHCVAAAFHSYGTGGR